MKKLMRLLAAVLALTMLCEMLPLAAFAQSDIGQAVTAAVQGIEEENSEIVASGEDLNVTWSLDSDGLLIISGSGPMGEMYAQWPPNLAWRKYNQQIKKVIINSGVTSISEVAFEACFNLTEVELCDTITSIEKNAFFVCENLKKITLPKQLTEISHAAFQGCKSLTSVVIPPNVTKIDDSAFAYCENMESVSIPAGVNTIGEWAFRNCSALKEVYYGGDAAQWSAISIAEHNDPLLDAQLRENSYYYEPSTPVTPPDQPEQPDEDTGFIFERDNPSFLNNDGYFFNYRKTDGSVWDSFKFLVEQMFSGKKEYNLSDEKFQQLTEGFSKSTMKFIQKQKKTSWGGSCFGMCSLAFLHYLEPSRIPLEQVEQNASNVYELAYPKDSTDVENVVNYYHLMQFFPTFFNYRADCVTRYQKDWKIEVEAIADELRNERPVHVSIGSHRVLLVRLKEETADAYTIGVYDPNYATEQTMTLYRNEPYYSKKDNRYYLKISYGDYVAIYNHVTAQDIEFIDLRNYFGQSNYETKSDYDRSHVTFSLTGKMTLKMGDVYVRAVNGKLVEISSGVQVYQVENDDDDNVVELVFPKSGETFEMTVEPDEGSNTNTDIMLNDTLLSVATDGAVTVSYNEQSRDVSLTADKAIEANLLMTQNTASDAWPWHSWALDTTGTTTLQAKLDDEGLHLTGDGIANAQYAMENGDTEDVATGTITDEPDDEGIVSTVIKADSGEPVEPVIPPSDDGGAGIVLAIGAAATVAAGIGAIALMPVKVEGKVELADHTALPGAKIALLQNGKVVAQTTTDADGKFALKVKRGSYELTAAYTDANGQLMHKTASFKAPAKNLTVTF